MFYVCIYTYTYDWENFEQKGYTQETMDTMFIDVRSLMECLDKWNIVTSRKCKFYFYNQNTHQQFEIKIGKILSKTFFTHVQ